MNEWAVLLCIVLFIASAFGLSERVERRDGMETGAQKRGNMICKEYLPTSLEYHT